MMMDDQRKEHLAPADLSVRVECESESRLTETHNLPIASRLDSIRPSAGHRISGIPTAGINERDELHLLFMRRRDPEICLPLVRGRRTTPVLDTRSGKFRQLDTWDDLVGAIQEIAPTTLEGVNQRVIKLATTQSEITELQAETVGTGGDYRSAVSRLSRPKTLVETLKIERPQDSDDRAQDSRDLQRIAETAATRGGQ
ncbi:hypothetical protein Tco_0307318 [Tanacetum coccineum]